jgi:hypothetical protein
MKEANLRTLYAANPACTAQMLAASATRHAADRAALLMPSETLAASQKDPQAAATGSRAAAMMVGSFWR